MNQLTWDDLFVDASLLDFHALLSEWSGLKVGQIRPIGASAFGDLFFEHRSGEVVRLDVLEGGLHPVATDLRQFGELMNTLEWQEQNLLSRGIALLNEKGICRGPGQFFGFAPHPSLAGKVEWSRVVPLDAVVWIRSVRRFWALYLHNSPCCPKYPPRGRHKSLGRFNAKVSYGSVPAGHVQSATFSVRQPVMLTRTAEFGQKRTSQDQINPVSVAQNQTGCGSGEQLSHFDVYRLVQLLVIGVLPTLM
ncbi:hypothetical protein [Massilia sp. CCM 8734]|uniref:hypothetical protein n=1 Tax=Massilia sp. CCM 8734 TaxID=2609283 RepID=UPI00141EBBB5|nr:hypothetical protein [Massilia sp. CCM 8734]NHZ96417.1 hypothetical protein [Massilia sp. CCM 8734]